MAVHIPKELKGNAHLMLELRDVVSNPSQADALARIKLPGRPPIRFVGDLIFVVGEQVKTPGFGPQAYDNLMRDLTAEGIPAEKKMMFPEGVFHPDMGPVEHFNTLAGFFEIDTKKLKKLPDFMPDPSDAAPGGQAAAVVPGAAAAALVASGAFTSKPGEALPASFDKRFLLTRLEGIATYLRNVEDGYSFLGELLFTTKGDFQGYIREHRSRVGKRSLDAIDSLMAQHGLSYGMFRTKDAPDFSTLTEERRYETLVQFFDIKDAAPYTRFSTGPLPAKAIVPQDGDWLTGAFIHACLAPVMQRFMSAEFKGAAVGMPEIVEASKRFEATVSEKLSAVAVEFLKGASFEQSEAAQPPTRPAFSGSWLRKIAPPNIRDGLTDAFFERALDSPEVLEAMAAFEKEVRAIAAQKIAEVAMNEL